MKTKKRVFIFIVLPVLLIAASMLVFTGSGNKGGAEEEN